MPLIQLIKNKEVTFWIKYFEMSSILICILEHKKNILLKILIDHQELILLLLLEE